jgi:phosphate transport system permease protein
MAGTTSSAPAANIYAAGLLGRRTPWLVLTGSMVVSFVLFWLLQAATPGGTLNVAGAVIVGAVLYAIAIYTFSFLVEGSRKAKDRLVTALVCGAFLLALAPLVSLLSTVVINGLARFDLEFFTYSMRSIVGAGGGFVHAMVGTLLMTLTATVISVPIGLMTSVYLVEYGRGPLARAITFFVDVMTGIPSIVAGLFAYSIFALLFGPGVKLGIAGAISLTVLMIPVVVRSSEDMLKLVPNELREASYALGVPKWLTILKVVLPTSVAGIMTGVILAIARIIGETAPLLIICGATDSLNFNIFNGRIMTLPVFIYAQYKNPGFPPEYGIERAWGAALVLTIIIMVLNLVARLISYKFSPKTKA